MTAHANIDADILLALADKAQARETDMGNVGALTWPQIRYWAIASCLGVGGLGAIVGAQFIPTESVRLVVGELGVAFLTAGLLAGLVEPFFRSEFARDAFLAAFRYVLPAEFREEVEKILRFDFIAEKQVWRVQIEKKTEELVLVTTTFERVIKNKTKSNKSAMTWYQVDDFKLQGDFPTKIIECGIESDLETSVSTDQTNLSGYEVGVTTKEIMIEPDKRARLWGSAIQYRRKNDVFVESFRQPIIDPEIEVIIDENAFDHRVAFGTYGDVKKSQYASHYTLSGVYFPGQIMAVRWWPRQNEGPAP